MFYISKICRVYVYILVKYAYLIFILFLVQDADSLLYLEDEINPKLNKQQKHLLAIIGNLIFCIFMRKILMSKKNKIKHFIELIILEFLHSNFWKSCSLSLSIYLSFNLYYG